jgi:hypothetical protein
VLTHQVEPDVLFRGDSQICTVASSFQRFPVLSSGPDLPWLWELIVAGFRIAIFKYRLKRRRNVPEAIPLFGLEKARVETAATPVSSGFLSKEWFLLVRCTSQAKTI